MSDEPTRRRLINIAVRMAEGETFFFSSCAPRISRREVDALNELGLVVQDEHGLHEDHIAYMMTGRGIRSTSHEDRFKERLAELIEEDQR